MGAAALFAGYILFVADGLELQPTDLFV